MGDPRPAFRLPARELWTCQIGGIAGHACLTAEDLAYEKGIVGSCYQHCGDTNRHART